ncbi:peptidoglycan recognition protein 1-like [Macrosteles quadrilineatus]|uniref:peptidoglycan recognition protein 1-like n=1 Tax=Macrosteles quadrilineatus TaxID=74068 RepID=UPI0023E166C9|nr:peptidoglycan recognition protein 1-like [Macrosteles quadrilineatus]
MLEVVTRREWGAAEASRVEYIRKPSSVKYIFLVSTHQVKCNDGNTCQRIVKDIQRRHITFHRVPDIKYNFLVGGDGAVYEGRGFNVVGTIPCPYYQLRFSSIMIALIGEFSESPPPLNMLDAFRGIVKTGIDRGYIAPKTLVFHL